MGILDRFENGVERVVNNAIAKAFKSELKPLDLSSALRREVDDRAAIVGRDRTVVPNEFTIELSSADYDQVESWGAEALADEFANNVTDYAASQRYAFVGPVTVSFSEDAELEAARFRVHSATVRGAVAPASATSAPAPGTRWWTSTASATSSPGRSRSSGAGRRRTSSSTTRASPAGTWRSA